MQELKKSSIERLFTRFETDARTLAGTNDLTTLYEELRAFHIREQVGPGDPYPKDSPEYHRIRDRLGGFLARFHELHECHDVLLICAAHGHVMHTTAGESDLGENLSVGPLRDSSLARIWNQVRSTDSFALVDFAPYAPSADRPFCFAGAPLHDSRGRLYGVLAPQISIEEIDTIMQERTGMGESGETYLVGPDKRMRSDSYLDIIGHSVEASFRGTVAENGVDTEGSRQALAGRRGEGAITDYNGNLVLSAYAPLDLPGAFAGRSWRRSTWTKSRRR